MNKKEVERALLDSYFKSRSLVAYNIESFNKFVKYEMQKIVDSIKEVSPDVLPEGVRELKIKFGKIKVEKPMLTEVEHSREKVAGEKLLPMECRLRNISYEGRILLEMSLIKNGIEVDKKLIHIGNLPIMVKSEFCNLHGLSKEELIKANEDPSDPGGYFLINGNEKVVVIVEDLAPNRIIVEKKNEGVVAKVFSESRQYRVLHTFEENNGVIYITFSRVLKLPVIYLFKALGVTKDSEIFQMISEDPKLFGDIYLNLYKCKDAKSRNDALKLIGKKLGIVMSEEVQIERAKDIINRVLLPHIGGEEASKDKAYFLGRVIRKMLMVKNGMIKEDDKDHLKNKRLRLVGDLFYSLFNYAFRKFVSDIKYTLERNIRKGKLPSLAYLARPVLLTSYLRSAMATGEWVGDRHGIAQHMDRMNTFSVLSHLRRVVSLLSTEVENFDARQLHPTQYGMLCSVESPEGVNIGLRKHLAIMAEISTEPSISDKEVIKLLKKAGMNKVNEESVDVFLNNKLVGSVENGEEFAKTIRELRRENKLPHELNVSYDDELNVVYIFTEKGRLRRPLIIVKDGKPLLTEEHLQKLKNGQLTWDDLVKEGIIEYLDAEEEENCLIAPSIEEVDKRHTHVEITPLAQFGINGALVTYAEHNPAFRDALGAKMHKQAIGIYATNFLLRADTDSSILHYPQKPIVKSVMAKYVDLDHHPIGQNVVVAVIPFYGYNGMDAIVINKGSIDRGLFRSTYFKPYETVESKKLGGQTDRIEIPTKDVAGYRVEEVYRLLEEDGIVYVGAEVEPGDVVIGKTSPPRFLNAPGQIFAGGVERRIDNSVSVKPSGGKGIVDEVIVTQTIEGEKLVKVKIREERIPELGDKFANRHGQKGVIGMIVREEDVPFSSEGIRPDIIFNSHSLPSRMSYGFIVELLAGKVASLRGREVDGTPWSNESEFDLRKALLELGFRENGVEWFYDGKTGKYYRGLVFVGNMYYFKLKYMAANKLHARSIGPVQLLTRQPTEGRAREGGLRLGEMEKDCFVAHGAAMVLKERWESDKKVFPICKKCGNIAVYNPYKDKAYCPVCGEDVEVAFVEMSYSFKLLLDELKSLCLYPKLIVGSD